MLDDSAAVDRARELIREATDAIRAEVRKSTLPLDKTLWTREQLADYLGAESRATLDRIMALPGFPRAKAIGHGRWIAGDVIEWAREQ